MLRRPSASRASPERSRHTSTMGLAVSRMEAAAGAMPPITDAEGDAAAEAAANAAKDSKPTTGTVNYNDLPCPVKYEEMQREVMMSLKADLFEGARFDYNKQLNQKFFLSHGFFLGNVEVPAQGGQIIKIPTSTYEFGANVVDQHYMLVGRVLTDGRVNGRIKYDLSDWLSVKLQSTKETGFSQVMFDADFKGLDYQAQLKYGSGQFYGVNYLQSVTPTLSLGGEGFYLGSQGKSGVGFAARYADDKTVATGQIATTGLLSLTYCTKVSEKAMLASDFLWNWNQRNATASVGYDYILRQCRIRGRIDNHGVVSTYLEERLNVGLNLILSAEVDHANKNHKFGFGMTVGE
jgi:mitochondrial import receptor subunit TOM40